MSPEELTAAAVRMRELADEINELGERASRVADLHGLLIGDLTEALEGRRGWLFLLDAWEVW